METQTGPDAENRIEHLPAQKNQIIPCCCEQWPSQCPCIHIPAGG